jgi:hypothetical protein
MIYFMKHRHSKPKRIREDYARDFFQMWFGNDEGTMMFNNGDHAWMPQSDREFQLWGEEMTESGWFKQILNGNVEDGYVSFDNINAVSECWTSTGVV